MDRALVDALVEQAGDEPVAGLSAAMTIFSAAMGKLTDDPELAPEIIGAVNSVLLRHGLSA